MFYPLVAMMNKTFVFREGLGLSLEVDRCCPPLAFMV
jgi:hypothetical protein